MKQWRKGSLRAVIALYENFYGTASEQVVEGMDKEHAVCLLG